MLGARHVIDPGLNSDAPQRLLQNFRDSMGPEDFLLLGTELFSRGSTELICRRSRASADARDFVLFLPNTLGLTASSVSLNH